MEHRRGNGSRTVGAGRRRAAGRLSPGGPADVDEEVLVGYTRRFADWVAEFASPDLRDQVRDALGLDPSTP
ncbi:hypothetical protein [Actinocatenispora rupis]|uniref:Uncharacterized protein n=1 Tax=Actinocatenispora rupis TaxID=519421 RepID=A0A8J3JEP0_9ACTN|nr:hypothetical protein [Actinocatenispora rupis]GID14548.1 hypothetical protein Aru02nite_54370 [Actinocatenispora rupis]